MNMQEQIEKMAKILQDGELDYQRGKFDRKEFSSDVVVNIGLQRLAGSKALIKAGYINGTDFVEWLKNKYKAEYDRWKGVAISIRIDDIDELLQEYLKGE